MDIYYLDRALSNNFIRFFFLTILRMKRLRIGCNLISL